MPVPPKLPQDVIDRLSRNPRSIPFPREKLKPSCCEAQMYLQIVGMPSAVLKFCDVCKGEKMQ